MSNGAVSQQVDSKQVIPGLPGCIKEKKREKKQNEREEEKKRKQKSRDELEEDLYRRIGLRRVGGEGREGEKR